MDKFIYPLVIVYAPVFFVVLGVVPKRTEHGYIAHILADFGNRKTSGHGNFYFDRCLTDIVK